MNRLFPYQQISKAMGFSVAIMGVPPGKGGALSNGIEYIYFVL